MIPAYFFPSIRRGNGTGHLVRCLYSADKIAGTSILVHEPGVTIDVDSVSALFPSVLLEYNVPGDPLLVIVDQRWTPEEKLSVLHPESIVVAVDESGPLRNCAEYVVDSLLPPQKGRKRPNIRVGIAAPDNRRSDSPQAVRTALIAYGGEDPAGLSELTLEALRIDDIFSTAEVSLLRGASFPEHHFFGDVHLIEPQPNIRERFADYDVVFTSFGLTAREARAAGCSVAVVDPSRYHAKLSRREGFFRLGTRRISKAKLRRLGASPAIGVRNTRDSSAPVASESVPPQSSLAELLTSIRFGDRNRCPVCGSTRNLAVARFPTASYFRCGCAGLIYRVGFEASAETYDSDYFFADYRAQYGKTYLEDFESIRKAGEGRLDRIATIRPLTKGEEGSLPSSRLLDIGCAYGAFLRAAVDRGYDAFGIDVAESPVAYVRDRLEIDVARVDALDFEPGVFGRSMFDVVTLWYVIEHFARFGDLLKRIARWTAPGGILAFSTPNLRGVSGRFGFRRFLDGSPQDHFVILSKRSARLSLRRFGFTVVGMRTTGHHPERFPILGRVRFLHGLIARFSRMTGLGDTFEVYARKSRNQ